jgi:hypothetical protein
VAAELRGQVLPFDDERNPFAGGFIDLGGTDGVGIHGTKFDPALGTKASHGCVRHGRRRPARGSTAVPLGAPVFIY